MEINRQSTPSPITFINLKNKKKSNEKCSNKQKKRKKLIAVFFLQTIRKAQNLIFEERKKTRIGYMNFVFIFNYYIFVFLIFTIFFNFFSAAYNFLASIPAYKFNLIRAIAVKILTVKPLYKLFRFIFSSSHIISVPWIIIMYI